MVHYSSLGLDTIQSKGLIRVLSSSYSVPKSSIELRQGNYFEASSSTKSGYGQEIDVFCKGKKLVTLVHKVPDVEDTLEWGQGYEGLLDDIVFKAPWNRASLSMFVQNFYSKLPFIPDSYTIDPIVGEISKKIEGVNLASILATLTPDEKRNIVSEVSEYVAEMSAMADPYFLGKVRTANDDIARKKKHPSSHFRYSFAHFFPKDNYDHLSSIFSFGEFASCFCHGDLFNLGNIIVNPDTKNVNGLIDFGNARVGHYYEDIYDLQRKLGLVDDPSTELKIDQLLLKSISKFKLADFKSIHRAKSHLIAEFYASKYVDAASVDDALSLLSYSNYHLGMALSKISGVSDGLVVDVVSRYVNKKKSSATDLGDIGELLSKDNNDIQLFLGGQDNVCKNQRGAKKRHGILCDYVSSNLGTLSEFQKMNAFATDAFLLSYYSAYFFFNLKAPPVEHLLLVPLLLLPYAAISLKNRFKHVKNRRKSIACLDPC